MRYLRMFSNAAIAGALGAAYVSLLILQLNPNLLLYPGVLAPLLIIIGLSYGAHLTATYYALIVFRQVLAARIISPGWISVRLLAWLFTASAGAAAALMWANLRSFGPMLDADTARTMALGATGLTACALVFLGIALVYYSFGRRGGAVGAPIIALTALASIALPVLARGPGTPAPLQARPLDFDLDLGHRQVGVSPRVVLILIDGGSLDFVSAATVEGRLPNFGKILDSGAAMHLATLRPTQPEPVWTSVATGKLPAKTGVRSSARYLVRASSEPIELLPDHCFSHVLVRFGLVSEILHTSPSVRTRTVWSILGGAGVPIGVVGWPLTYPAQPVRGFLVTDILDRLGDAPLDPDDHAVGYPAETLPTVRMAVEARSWADVPPPGELAWPVSPEVVSEVFAGRPFSTDRLYEQVWRTLGNQIPVRVTAVRFRGIDAAGHRYLRDARPRLFGDVPEDEARQYGRVLEASYAIVDAAIGRAMATLAPGDLLLVVSGFGMEPLGPGKRLLERVMGNRELTSSHERAPDGFLLAYGTAVAPGRKQRASLVDVTPTLLYFLGLPVARDMDGYARADVFRREFTSERPIAFIPTYDR
jgi:predicted AlkP superfamily phosphohydrolase/phosphomutase